MADKNGAQTGSAVELGFKREDAEHEINPARHLVNTSAVPCPHLRADVVNDFGRRVASAESARETQVKSGIIDQNDGVGSALFDALKSVVKFSSEVSILLQHFPQAEHAGTADPILHSVAGDSSHFRSAAPNKPDIGIPRAQRLHYGRAVVVRARLACDEVQRLHPIP